LTIIPSTMLHSPNAMPGHIGYPPGDPMNPYSSLGLWYYVPLYTAQHFAEAAAFGSQQIDRSRPLFGLANPEHYLLDLSKFGDKLDVDGQPVLLDGMPVQQSVPSSGAISMYTVNSVFGWGNDINAYKGRRWYTDGIGYGDFPTGNLSLLDFYGKRPDDPVTAGAWDQQGTGYYDFYTPLHRSIGTQRVGGGGGGGGNGNGGTGGQTWAFPGGNPVNGGGGGGWLYSSGNGGTWGTENEHAGDPGYWGNAGNANNIAGTGGGTVGGTGYLWIFNTGAGGNSAWAAGGASFQGNIDAGTRGANNGVFGSGSSGGFQWASGTPFYCWGDGGGGAGYTYDSWGSGVIGGVVNIYVAVGGACPAGGQGGNGRCYVNWG